jgi:hypothetical protein
LVDEEGMDELLTLGKLPAGQLAESLDNGHLYAEVGPRRVMSVQNVQPAQELFKTTSRDPARHGLISMQKAS